MKLVFSLAALALLVGGCTETNPMAKQDNPANPMCDIKKLGIVIINASTRDFFDDPLINEITQTFHNELQQFPGFESTIPAPAVYNLMRVRGYQLPNDAVRIANEIGADGLVVGLINDYYPYGDFRVSMDLILFPVNQCHQVVLNVDQLQNSGIPLEGWEELDLNIRVHRVIDASHASTRKLLERYAKGRTSADFPEDSNEFTLVMNKYMQFVSNQMIRSLIQEACARLQKARKCPPVLPVPVADPVLPAGASVGTAAGLPGVD